jgi:hypothetical protein
MCEFFDNVDASQLIRSAVVQHFTWCTKRPIDFSGDILLIYADIVVEAYRRLREYRKSRRQTAP